MIKFITIISFLLFNSLLFGQKYFIEKNLINDSILLNEKFKEIVLKEYSKFIRAKKIDSLKTKIKQEVFLGDFSSAINTIKEYRNQSAINNWDGNLLFSFEVFSITKLLQINENINFDKALDKVIIDKINNLDEILLIDFIL